MLDRYLGTLDTKITMPWRARVRLGNGKPTPAAAYPPLLCKQIAEWAFSVFDEAKSRGMDTSGQGLFFPFEELSPASDLSASNEAECLAAKALRVDMFRRMSCWLSPNFFLTRTE